MRVILTVLMLCPMLVMLSGCGACNASGSNSGKTASCAVFSGRF